MPTIRTMNFEAMDLFYRTKLRMNAVIMESNGSTWFKDFSTEIHIDQVKNPDDVGVEGSLILWATDVEGVAQMFSDRGIPITVRDWESTKEALLQDPDNNLLAIRPEAKRPKNSPEPQAARA